MTTDAGTLAPTPSLFREKDRAELVRRIESLRPDARPVWGRMTVGQMLAHCQAPLRVATGELVLKRSLVGLLFGRLARKKLLAPAPFARNLPTATQFVVRDARDAEAERGKLLALVRRFGEAGPAGLTRDAHPFFGPLTVEEWDALQAKHLDHHLRQFGA